MNHLAITLKVKSVHKPTLSRVFVMTLLFWLSFYSDPVQATHFDEMSYEEIFERSALVRMILDAETGDIVLVNKATEAFYGYTEEQLLSMKIQDINTLDDQQVYEKRMEALHEGTNLFIFDHQLANGEIRTVEVYVHPFVSHDRAYLQTTIYDITPKLQAMEKIEQNRNTWIISLSAALALFAALLLLMLKRRQEKKANIRRLEKQIIRYQALVRDKMIIPWEYNPENGEYAFSRQPLNLGEGLPADAHYQQHQPLKSFIENYVHPDDQQQTLNRFTDYLRNPLSYTGDQDDMYEDTFRIMNPQGEWCWVLSRGKILQRSETELITVGLMIDIETLKQLERQLYLEKEKAEQVAMAKARFLANMSHELRTPLNGIMGMLQILKISDLKKDQEECVQAAYHSSKLLLSLINDVLDYSKLQGGELIIREDLINLEHICTQVLMLMENQASSKGIALNLQVSEEVPSWVVGDELRIRQILFNLVGNAVKFTSEGFVNIHVSCQGYTDEAQAIIDIQVADSGMGISEEFIPYLFDRFTQADETIKRRLEGTGLGLAISKQLAELMGGSIDVKSQVNQGTTFFVTLPMTFHSEPEKPFGFENN